MGYRSEVAYAVAFPTSEALDAFLASRPPDEVAGVFEDGAKRVDGGRVLVYHEESIKWYATKLVPGYASVDRHVSLLDAAENEWTGSPTTGVFARIGEEWDDMEYDYWDNDLPFEEGGFAHPLPEGGKMPSSWELIQVQRFIEPLWKEES